MCRLCYDFLIRDTDRMVASKPVYILTKLIISVYMLRKKILSTGHQAECLQQNKNEMCTQFQLKGKQQLCLDMNKIWELLKISILMTNHHANQLITVASNGRALLGHVKMRLRTEMCSGNFTEFSDRVKKLSPRFVD